MDNVEDFILSLYEMSDNEIKELYKLLKDSKNKYLQKIANIMLDYNIVNDGMSMKNIDKIKLSTEFEKILKLDFNKVAKLEVILIEKILVNVSESTFKYWNYNIGFKDVKGIINAHYKGKHFSDRVWDNELEVAKKINSLMKDFLDGKIGVNRIKKEIDKAFNTGAYEIRRLVETEVARVGDESFKRFCKETEVNKIKRNAVLDKRTCDDCDGEHAKIYTVEKAPSLPAHPLCRCFWEIVE